MALPRFFARLYPAFLASLKGGHVALREAAFQQELLLFSFLTLLGFFCGFSWVQHCVQCGLFTIVLVTETLNTAIEKIVDRIGLERDVLSGMAKDLGSFAVLLSFLPLLLFWIIVLFHE